jgi:hypothetical protein
MHSLVLLLLLPPSALLAPLQWSLPATSCPPTVLS